MTVRTRILLGYGVLAFLAVLPLLLTLLALTIASVTGAPLSDNMPAPVSTLSTVLVLMAYSGMLTIYTLPLGLFLMVVYTIFLLIRHFHKRRQAGR